MTTQPPTRSRSTVRGPASFPPSTLAQAPPSRAPGRRASGRRTQPSTLSIGPPAAGPPASPGQLTQAPPRKHLAAVGRLPIRPPAQGPPAAGPPASPRPADASATAQAPGRRGTTTHPPTRSRSTGRGGRQRPHVQAAQAPPLELQPLRGWQPPPGARTVRNLIACSCHRTGHDTGPTTSHASRRAPPEKLRLDGPRPPSPPTRSYTGGSAAVVTAPFPPAAWPRPTAFAKSRRPNCRPTRSSSGHRGMTSLPLGPVPCRVRWMVASAALGTARPLPALSCKPECLARAAPGRRPPPGPPTLRSSVASATAVTAPFPPADRLRKLRRTAPAHSCRPPCPAGAARPPPILPAPPAVEPLRSRHPPPADWLRKLRQTARPLSAHPHRQPHSPSCKAGVSALEPAAKQPASGPPGRPHPIPHPPAHLNFPHPWPRSVRGIAEAFPHPTARELPAPGSGGGGANAGRGFRKGSLVPNPALRATPRLRASPLHKRPFM